MKTVGYDGPDGDKVDEDYLDDGLPVVPLDGGGEAGDRLQSVQSNGRQA